MKKYTLILLSAIFIFNMAKAQNNLVLQSEKPKFSVTFPAKYKLKESKTEKGLKSAFYKAEKNGEIYLFKYSEHKNPAVSADNQHYLNASLQSFIDGIKAELIKKYNFKEKKQKGLEAFLKMPDKNLYAFYRVIIHKHIQYQIIVITKSKEKNNNIKNFFNSFKI